MGRIKTYEDARDYLGYVVSYNRSVSSLAKLQTILDALNEKHKFNLLTGTVWYPRVRFFRMKSVPKDAEVIGHFDNSTCDILFIVVVNGDMYEIPSSEITVKSTLTLTDKWDKYKVSL